MTTSHSELLVSLPWTETDPAPSSHLLPLTLSTTPEVKGFQVKFYKTFSEAMERGEEEYKVPRSSTQA